MRRPSIPAPALASLLLLFAIGPAPASGARKAHKVSGTVVSGANLLYPQLTAGGRISPDGEWIVYIQDAQTNGAFALWAARRAGGAPKRMSGTLAVGSGSFHDLRFTPDSRHVLYSVDLETSLVHDLYTVPLLGDFTDAVKLNPPQTNGGLELLFALSGDGQRVVFRAENVIDGHRLFSAPVDGSSPAIALDGPLTGSGTTTHFVIAGDRVVYVGRENAEPLRVWSVPLLGPSSENVRLSDEVAQPVSNQAPRLSPDGTRAAFQVGTVGDSDLWIAPVGGATSSAIRLVAATAEGGVSSFRFAPDGTRLVFFSDKDVSGMTELFSVAADGASAAVQLNAALPSYGDVTSFDFSPDGFWAVYVADGVDDGQFELYSVPVTGPSTLAERISRTLATSESIGWPVQPTAEGVIYQIMDSESELRAAPYGGPPGSGWHLAGPSQDLFSGIAAPLQGRYVFEASLAEHGRELWTVPFDGTSAPEDLFGVFWTSADVEYGSRLGPDESEFFFVAEVGAGPRQIYVTRTDGSQANPTGLSPEAPSGGDVSGPIEVTPDGHGVLYEVPFTSLTREDLYIADALVFAADFDEEGDVSEWSSSTP